MLLHLSGFRFSVHWRTALCFQSFYPTYTHHVYLKRSGLLSQVYDYNLTCGTGKFLLNPEENLPNSTKPSYHNTNRLKLDSYIAATLREKNMRKKERICVFGSHSGQSCLSYSLPSFSLSSVPLPFFLLTFPVPLPLSLTSGGYLVWLCDFSPAMGQPVFGLDVRLQCVSANVGRKG